MADRSQDAVEDEVEFFANVLREEPQHQIAILLHHLILAPIAAIRDRIVEVLGTIQLHGNPSIGAEQIDFEAAATIEGDRHICIEAEAVLRLR